MITSELAGRCGTAGGGHWMKEKSPEEEERWGRRFEGSGTKGKRSNFATGLIPWSPKEEVTQTGASTIGNSPFSFARVDFPASV